MSRDVFGSSGGRRCRTVSVWDAEDELARRGNPHLQVLFRGLHLPREAAAATTDARLRRLRRRARGTTPLERRHGTIR